MQNKFLRRAVLYIFWRIHLLLSNDHEINEITVVARQRPARKNRSTVEGGFLCGPLRGYIMRPAEFMLTTDLLLRLWLWQSTEPSSPQSERPTSTSLQLFDSNKDLVLSPRWVLYYKTDWPTDRWP
jgi:hypothetical protein